jgi:putative transposase
MSDKFRIHEQNHAYFITNVIVHWIPVFCREDYFRILVDSLTYCSEHKGLDLHGYVIMPNHFHMIGSQEDGRLSDALRDMKKHTSKQIAALIQADGRTSWLAAMRHASDEPGGVRVWDETFHPEQVYSREFFEQKLDYIHNNPVRAGFVADPSAWKYSSAGFYYHDTASLVPLKPIPW